MPRASHLRTLGSAALLVALLMPAGLCLCGRTAAEPSMSCHESGPETEVSAACCCASELSSDQSEAALPRPQERPTSPPVAGVTQATLETHCRASGRPIRFDLRPPEAPPPAFSTPLRI
ncbi:MAG TPA: hypothetical protein VF017_12680 [Thermoanaerobaculia bacterium]|nr:hypothetical protein [Thermoanaerobaculia bacterium]